MPILASRSLHTEAIGVALDAATLAWVAAVISNGGSVSDARKTIVNTLIVGLKADSIWTKLDRLWPFAAENEGSALTDLVARELATNNSAAFTADQGYTGNGSSAYIDSNFVPGSGSPNFAQNSACFFAWNNTSGTDAGGLAGYSSASGLNDIRIFPEFSDTNSYWNINDATGVSLAWDGRTGLYLLNRSASNAASYDVNGSEIDTDANASDAPSATFSFVALQAGGGSGFTSRQCSCLGFGAGLSSGERADIFTRLRTYMDAVGVP